MSQSVLHLALCVEHVFFASKLGQCHTLPLALQACEVATAAWTFMVAYAQKAWLQAP